MEALMISERISREERMRHELGRKGRGAGATGDGEAGARARVLGVAVVVKPTAPPSDHAGGRGAAEAKTSAGERDGEGDDGDGDEAGDLRDDARYAPLSGGSNEEEGGDADEEAFRRQLLVRGRAGGEGRTAVLRLCLCMCLHCLAAASSASLGSLPRSSPLPPPPPRPLAPCRAQDEADMMRFEYEAMQAAFLKELAELEEDIAQALALQVRAAAAATRARAPSGRCKTLAARAPRTPRAPCTPRAPRALRARRATQPRGAGRVRSRTPRTPPRAPRTARGGYGVGPEPLVQVPGCARERCRVHACAWHGARRQQVALPPRRRCVAGALRVVRPTLNSSLTRACVPRPVARARAGRAYGGSHAGQRGRGGARSRL